KFSPKAIGFVGMPVLAAHYSTREENVMHRIIILGALAILVLTLSTSAIAQAQYGTAAEAKAMLEKVIAAVKADKDKALAMFNKGESGFKDRDLQPFCFNISDGKILVSTNPNIVALGTDVRTLKDKTGKVFGDMVFNAAQQDKIMETGTYMFPRP